MARQMEQQGLEVGLLILVDAAFASHFNWLKALIRYGGNLARVDVEAQAGVYTRLRRHLINARRAYREGGLGKLLQVGLSKARGDLAGLLGTPHVDPQQRLREVQFHCSVLNYQPRPYPGRVVLLRTKSLQGSSSQDHSAGWGKLAPQIEVHDLPGDHSSCQTEHAGALAEHIGRALRAYHADAHGALPQSTCA
jgi:thioesterase domain-containing protein